MQLKTKLQNVKMLFKTKFDLWMSNDPAYHNTGKSMVENTWMFVIVITQPFNCNKEVVYYSSF